MSFRLLFAMVALVSVQGCVNTSYHDTKEKEPALQIAERRVKFWLNDSIFNKLYPCIYVIPQEPPGTALLSLAERSFERHLYQKFEKVVSSRAVKKIAEKQMFDIYTRRGVSALGKKMHCPVTASIRIKEMNNSFLMFYAQKSLKIEARLEDVKTGDLLWQSEHHAGRGDGALPLSPLSAISSVVRASRISGDSEQFESILDDAVRRMARTIPSFKIDVLEKDFASRNN